MNFPEALGDLVRLRQALDAQAHHIRAGREPLALLLRQAQVLEDARLAAAVGTALERSGKPWLKQLWTTARALSAHLRVLHGHHGRVFAAALTADGRRAVSWAVGDELHIWNVQTGATIAEFSHAYDVTALAISADGKDILVGLRDGTLQARNLETGVCHSFKGHSRRVTALALLEERDCAMSASRDHRVKRWDLRTLTCTWPFTDPECSHAIALSDDGTFAISYSGRNLRIWEVATGATIRTLPCHDQQIWAAALSGHGERAVTGSSDGTVRFWDARTETRSPSLAGHAGPVGATALSADGKRAVSASWDKTLRVWDVEAALREAREHRSVREDASTSPYTPMVALSANGDLALSRSSSGAVQIWRTKSGIRERILSDPETTVARSYKGGVWGPERVAAFEPMALTAAFSADGRRVVAGYEDGTVRAWDVGTGIRIAILHGHWGPVSAVALSTDGSRASSGSYDDSVRVWDLDACTCLNTFRDLSAGPRTEVVWLSDEGRRLVANRSHGVRVWNLDTEVSIDRLTGKIVKALSADGQRAASIEHVWPHKHLVTVWDIESGDRIAALAGHEGEVKTAALSADGKRAISASDDGTVRAWDVASGECLVTMAADWITCCALSADGRRLFLGDHWDEVSFFELVLP